MRQYGTETWDILKNSIAVGDLGKQFECHITERELSWSIDNEWTQTANDFLWHRTRLGLKISDAGKKQIDDFIHYARKQKIGIKS
jgi:glycerol-3-phosphate dehydrogenase